MADHTPNPATDPDPASTAGTTTDPAPNPAARRVLRVVASNAAGTAEELDTNDPGADADPLTGQVPGRDGATFILDEVADVESRWGDSSGVLWARGESLLIAGLPGVGKTTVAGQVVGGLIGVLPTFLGFPIMPATRVLYLAMDRPRQVRRALRRFFTEDHRQALTDRLVVRPGPLPLDLAKSPGQLLELAQHYGCDVVVVDSLKDAAVKLTDDETGGNINRAIQLCNANDVDVLVLHHTRKGEAGAKTGPATLADIYGSTWITAGAGSVLLLHGEPGSEAVDLIHLKQPTEPVGPLKLEHDHSRGTTKVVQGFDPLAYIRHRGATGATMAEISQAQWGAPQKAGSANYKRTARKIGTLVTRGLLVCPDGPERDQSGAFAQPRYYLAAPDPGPAVLASLDTQPNPSGTVDTTVDTPWTPVDSTVDTAVDTDSGGTEPAQADPLELD